MAEYCTYLDVSNRLTEAGVTFCADTDQSGAVDPSESSAHVDTAIVYAGQEIDFAVVNNRKGLILSSVRAAGNAFLKQIAIDLASERLCTIGGMTTPDSISEAAARAREMLLRVENGKDVPGLTYPLQSDGQHSRSYPGVVNPKPLRIRRC